VFQILALEIGRFRGFGRQNETDMIYTLYACNNTDEHYDDRAAHISCGSGCEDDYGE
jgi:hypothetical protein